MKLNQVLVVVAVIVVVLIGFRVLMAGGPGVSDQQQIEQALAESIQASKEGRPGGVMDKLSTRLKFNSEDTGGNRNQIAEYIKTNRPDVKVLHKEAVVTGDEARIVSPVTISVNILGQELSKDLKEVTLVFRKEDDHVYLIFPTKKWKLAEVEVPDSTVYDFLQN